MLRRLIAALSSKTAASQPASITLLHQIFAPLCSLDADFADQAVGYVCTGQHPELLDHLTQRQDERAFELLAQPGNLDPWLSTYGLLSQAEKNRADASYAARDQLYQALFELLSPAQIKRYAELLAAASSDQQRDYFLEAAKPWFSLLIIDALCVTRDKALDLNSSRAHWRIDTLCGLFCLDGQSEQQFIQHIFNRHYIEHYENNQLDLIFELVDGVDFFIGYRKQLLQLIPSMTVGAQCCLLDLLNRQPQLIEPNAELLLTLAIGRSKTICKQLEPLLQQLPRSTIQAFIRQTLAQGSIPQRVAAIEQLFTLSGLDAAFLQQTLAQQNHKNLQHCLEQALQKLGVQTHVAAQDISVAEQQALSFQAIPQHFAAVLAHNHQQLREEFAEKVREQHPEDYRYASNLKQLTEFDALSQHEDIGNYLLALLNNDSKLKHPFRFLEQVVFYTDEISETAEYGLIHALRIQKQQHTRFIDWKDLFYFYLKPAHYAGLELRQLAQLMYSVGFNHAEKMIIDEYFSQSYSRLDFDDVFPDNDQIWPFFAVNPQAIDAALTPATQKDSSSKNFLMLTALELLTKFPSPPQAYLPRLFELALTESQTIRHAAQQVLKQTPDAHLPAIVALKHSQQERRLAAIELITQIAHPDAIPALQQLLKTERQERVIAHALTALEQLGADISDYLAASVLLKNAEKGLKAKISSSFTWFDLSNLPALRWQDGAAVEATIIKWWVVLAEKLKQPSANALLQRYLNLLDEDSQQRLSLHLLQSFIAEATQCMSLEEAQAIALRDAPDRLQHYQAKYALWHKTEPESVADYAHISLVQCQQEIIRECLNTPIKNSVIKSKGMLALIYKAPATQAVQLIQRFMQQHYQKRAQVEALLSAIALNEDPLVIQLLLGVARRHRNSTVQNLAQQLVEEIAERKQWSQDQLADRTIPSAGLDDQGILYLDYGQRQFTAYVDEKQQFVLKNPQAKIIQSLPAANLNEDPLLVKEAKALLSNSKKDFKQIYLSQSQRLYEAMCQERCWSSLDWQQYLLAHPIMQRLLQRLVWLEIDDQGQILQSFRPCEDQSLLNLEDEEIQLSPDSQIKIAHRVILTPDTAQAWQQHFKDYKVSELFAQMLHPQPPIADPSASKIDSHYGWMSDSFKFAKVMKKLGYQAASAEDGGIFDYYSKSFSQIAITMLISFSGSNVFAENNPVALFDISFEKQHKNGWTSVLSLAEVPAVLLAEGYADYLQLAAQCSGYDPNWQEKTL